MPAVCEVLWLDPVERLDNAVRARLGEAGLSVVVVSTLDELNAMLRRVQLVVVRLFEDGDLLTDVRRLIADNMLDLPVAGGGATRRAGGGDDLADWSDRRG